MSSSNFSQAPTLKALLSALVLATVATAAPAPEAAALDKRVTTGAQIWTSGACDSSPVFSGTYSSGTCHNFPNGGGKYGYVTLDPPLSSLAPLSKWRYKDRPFVPPHHPFPCIIQSADTDAEIAHRAKFQDSSSCKYKVWESADCHGKATVHTQNGNNCIPIANTADGVFYLSGGGASISIVC